MDPIKSGLDGLYLQLSPDDSCLAKTTTGLEVMVAPDGPLRKELLGLDIALNPDMTLVRSIAGIGGNYKGETPDITVAKNMIICNIDVGGKGLQKVGSIISLLPNVEEKIDKVDEMNDKLDTIPDDIASQLDIVAGDLTDMSSQIDNLANNLASVAENVMSTAAQLATAAATGAVGGGVSSGLALTAAGKLAKDGVQSLISENAAKVIGGGLAAASLAGILGGLLGSLGGKKTYNTYIIGDQGVSNSGVVEGTSDVAWGYSISQGYRFNQTLYPNKLTSMAVIGPMLGTNLSTVGSTSPHTGQWCVFGGMGVSEGIYAGGDIFMNTNQKVASENFVTTSVAGLASESYVNTNIGNKGFITSTASSPYLKTTDAQTTYLSITNAQNTYQPILTAGSNLTKTGNTISLNPDVTITALKSIDTQVFRRKQWVQPNMTSNSANGYILSCSSRASSTYDVWRLFDPAQADRWMSTGTYTAGVPNAPNTLADSIEYKGAWVQMESPSPKTLLSSGL
ncbi:hypothetical protein HK097_007629 [Rhizophlyctis rosea]|uniref:Uncharacterized protein n=1 Tax=Rhizophlyctis rosea TaxID=64517 RepID=A0AAD5SBG5_9FUNG|nr:hypothetical protein HK097_007629 [Rhizophlyctis rosea]